MLRPSFPPVLAVAADARLTQSCAALQAAVSLGTQGPATPAVTWKGPMRKTLTMLTLVLGLPALPALADEGCFVPMSDWQPREAVAKLAQSRGWEVRRIKIDDGCYEIDGRDASGRQIEVTVHPATLEVLKIEGKEKDEGEED